MGPHGEGRLTQLIDSTLVLEEWCGEDLQFTVEAGDGKKWLSSTSDGTRSARGGAFGMRSSGMAFDCGQAS